MHRITYPLALLYVLSTPLSSLFGSHVSFEESSLTCHFSHQKISKTATVLPPVLMACGEDFFDPGGPNGDYQPGQSQLTTICPDNPGDIVSVSFSEWDLDICCSATLEVHQGATLGNLIQVYDGNRRPLVATGFEPGCITFNFIAQAGATPAAGWAGEVVCSPCFPPIEHYVQMLTETTAELFVTVPFHEQLYVEVGPPGFVPNAGEATISKIFSNEFLFLDELEIGTTYDIYVSNVCGEMDTSAVYGPVPITTNPTCGGIFYDPAGPDNDINFNTNASGTICPPAPGELVQLEFTSFDLGGCCSQLELYDGFGTFWPPIGIYEGTNSPGTVTATQLSGCITFVLNTNGNELGPGWEANVSCVSCPSPNNLSLKKTSSTQADFIWDSVSPANFYYYEVGPPGFAPGTGASIASGNVAISNVIVPGLEANTPYEMAVRTHCNQFDTSGFSAPLPFTTSPSCGDFFYDSGGPDGNYMPTVPMETTICPDTPGLFVELVFDTFSVTEFGSLLELHDSQNGPNNFIGSWAGTNSPGKVSATNSSGCITALFYSNPVSVGEFGWAAQVNCVSCTAPNQVQIGLGIEPGYIFTWSDNSGAVSYLWEIVPAGVEPGTGNAAMSGTTDLAQLNAPLFGLESNTDYELYVSSICSPTDQSSFNGPVLFTTSPSCGDPFYDPGGPDENYPPFEFTEWTICPNQPDQFAQIVFESFNVHPCCASLFHGDGFIFNEINLTAGVPPPITSTNPNGCLTLSFDVFGDIVLGTGWEATINCVDCPSNERFQVEKVTSFSIEFSWDAMQIHEEVSWEIGEKGFLPGNGFGSGVVNFPFNTAEATGLAPATEYDIYLKGKCANNGTVAVSGPFSFISAPTCGGQFFDPAGPDSSSTGLPEPIITVICPDQPDQFVEVHFSEFDIPLSNVTLNELRVYDGPSNIISPFLTSLNGSLPPMTFTSTDDSGCLTFVFAVFSSQPFSGWVADVNCVTCPVVRTELESVTASSAEVKWKPVSVAEEYYWELGAGGFTPGTSSALQSGTNTSEFEISLTFDNLESGTPYTFYVRSLCGNDSSNFNQPLNFTTIPSCGDFFYDPGGPNDPYPNGTESFFTICPDADHQKVSATFNLFNTQSCCDFLSVFDGPDPNFSPILGSFSGNTAPGTFTSTHSEGCLSFSFFSDEAGVGNGWEAAITCTPPTSTASIEKVEAQLMLFPNPSADRFSVSFHASVSEKVALRVFDIFGNLIIDEIHNTKPGENTVGLNLTDVPAGTYLVSVAGSEEMMSQRLVKYQ